MSFNVEVPDDEIDLPDNILESNLASWDEIEEYLMKQLGLVKEE